jgi:TM2 domain-containing membrane protein YozV
MTAYIESPIPPPAPASVAPAGLAPLEAPKDPGIALVLELLPGIACQVWGLGSIYAGRVGQGLVIMVGYWIVQLVNVLLMFVLIGFLTAFATFVVTAVVASILAWNAARDSQERWRRAMVRA